MALTRQGEVHILESVLIQYSCNIYIWSTLIASFVHKIIPSLGSLCLSDGEPKPQSMFFVIIYSEVHLKIIWSIRQNMSY